MLGQPCTRSRCHDVVGVRFSRSLDGHDHHRSRPVVTQQPPRPRREDKFVEFIGPGLAALAVAERATIANMAPEYGATAAFFRSMKRRCATCARRGGMWKQINPSSILQRAGPLVERGDESPYPHYCEELVLDLARWSRRSRGRSVRRIGCRSGGRPRRSLYRSAGSPLRTAAMGPRRRGDCCDHHLHQYEEPGRRWSPRASSRKKARVSRGLTCRRGSKRSLAPGSRVVPGYLVQAPGCCDPFEAPGFHLVGFGCTTCGGKSGPLTDTIARGGRRPRTGRRLRAFGQPQL